MADGPPDTAAQAWAEAQEQLANHQELLAETREAASDLHQELIALRRALRAAVGTQHPDYPALRTNRSIASDEAEEAAVDAGETSRNSATVGSQPTDTKATTPPPVVEPPATVAPQSPSNGVSKEVVSA